MRAQFTHKTKAELEALNPILLDGEAVFEKDTRNIKVGDGIKNYKDLQTYGGSGTVPAIGQYYLCGVVFHIDYENKYIYVAALDKAQSLQMTPDEFTSLIPTNSNNDGFENTKIYTVKKNNDLINKYPVFYFLKNLLVNGFNDWFLPTLTNLAFRKAFTGILGPGYYWTSFISEQDGGQAFYLNVSAEFQEGSYEVGESFSYYKVVPVKKIKFS